MDQSVSHFVMYVLAVTIAVCVGIIVLFKGVDTVPHGWLGIGIAALLVIASLAMTRLKFGDGPGH